MMMKLTRIAVIALALALAGWTGAAAGDDVWVADDGEEINLHSAHVWSTSADDAEEFDLSDLADGESRVFGDGDKQVTVSRRGDEVTITHPPERDGSPMSIVCDLDSDDCKILTFDEGPARTAIMIRKAAGCDGDEDCDQILLTELAIGDEPSRIMIRKTIDCEGDDCAEADSVIRVGGKQSLATVQVMADGMITTDEHDVLLLSGDAAAHGFIVVGDGEEVVLRCPEGDTTMRVDLDEADETFLCPKHNVPLEKLVTTGKPHRVKIIKKQADED
jgi:hypothetical protein